MTSENKRMMKVKKTAHLSLENNSSESGSEENENIFRKRRAFQRAVKCMKSGDESSESESEVTTSNKEKQHKLTKDKLDEANRKNIACKICKEEFKTYSSFVSHQLSHKTKAKVFRCTICKMSFKHRTSYMNHQKREHPEIAGYACTFPGCDASYKTLKRRRNHEYIHYKYMCRFCKKRFTTKGFMRLHVKEVHPPKV